MAAAIRAGVLYFLGVFALGFVLGTLRTLVLVPRLGPLAAVALELPLMLAAAWWLCGAVLRRTGLPRAALLRGTMGAAAFLLLMAAELGVSVVALGRTPAEHWASFAGAAERLGLAGQLLYAVFPLLRRTA